MRQKTEMRRNRWTTPQKLHAALAGLCLGAMLLALTAYIGTLQHYSAVKTVGKDAAPSIIAAQSMKANLADLDANVTNELMVRPGQNFQSIAGYGQRRTEVGNALIHAAENITYGETERRPIQALETGLGDYGSYVSRARTLHERGDEAGALTAYHHANSVLNTILYPAADALAAANSRVMARTYARVSSQSTAMAACTLLVGVGLLALLLYIQSFLAIRMRRNLNPALAMSSLLTFGFLLLTIHAFHAAADHLRIAKEDAFTSIEALWQARAIAYDANTDESRWLFDRSQASAYEAAFFAKSALLLQVPAGGGYDTISAVTQVPPTSDMQGYFAREWANITFSGERDAMQETMRAYGVYYMDDKQIRTLENAGRHADAIAFCISMAPGESNWAFSRFDRALGRTLDINQKAFEQAIDAGFQDLRPLYFLCPLLGLSVAALAFVGLRPRLKEYA